MYNEEMEVDFKDAYLDLCQSLIEDTEEFIKEIKSGIDKEEIIDGLTWLITLMREGKLRAEACHNKVTVKFAE